MKTQFSTGNIRERFAGIPWTWTDVMKMIAGPVIAIPVLAAVYWLCTPTGMQVLLCIVAFLVLCVLVLCRSRILGFLIPPLAGIPRIEEKMASLETYVKSATGTNLLARFLKLDAARTPEKINIVFSHRDEEHGNTVCASDCFWGKVARPHDRKHRVSQSTSIPLTLEEANVIMQLWGTAYSCVGLQNIGLFCSCELVLPNDPRLREHLFLVGSSKTNCITEAALSRAQADVHFHRCTDRDMDRKTCKHPGENCSAGSPRNASEDFTANINPIAFPLAYYCPSRGEDSDSDKKDYALITAIQNPWDVRKRVFIFGGCRAAGALILQFLLTERCFLEYLICRSEECKQPSDPFSVIAEVTYRRGPNYPLFVEHNGVVQVRVYGPRKFNRQVPQNLFEIELSRINAQLEQMAGEPTQ